MSRPLLRRCVCMLAVAVTLAASALHAASLEYRSDGFFASPDARVKIFREPWYYTPHVDVDGAAAISIVGPVLNPGYVCLFGETTKTENDTAHRRMVESGTTEKLASLCRRTISEYRGGLLLRLEYEQSPAQITGAVCRFIFPVEMFKGRHASWEGGGIILPEAKPDPQHMVFVDSPRGETTWFRFPLGTGQDLGVKFLSPTKGRSFSDCRAWNEANYHLQAGFDGNSMLLYLCLLKPEEPFPNVPSPAKDEPLAVIPATPPVPPEGYSKGNLLRDGASFETGADGVRPFAAYSWNEKMVQPGITPLFDPGSAVHGKMSLHLTAEDSVKKGNARGFAFVGAVFNRVLLKRDRQYTLSAWMKTDQPGLKAIMYCGENSWNGSNWGAFPVTTQWKRYHHTFVTDDFKKSGFYLSWVGIDPQCKQGSLWIDAVQLEEGELTDFAPAAESEYGVEVPRADKLFQNDMECTADLRVRNNGDKLLAANVPYVIKDFWDQPARSGTVTVNVAAHDTAAYPVNLGKLPCGYYRGYFTVPGGDVREIIFGVYQPLPLTPLPDDWPLACHNDPSPLVRKLGFGSLRAFEVFEMSSIAPQQGKFDFSQSDRMVDEAERCGLSIMPVLGTFGWPSYRPQPPVPPYAQEKIGPSSVAEERRMVWPKIQAWKDYVRALTSHYKGRITYWEVLNEPNLMMNTAEYLPYLQAAYEAAKEGNPDCKVVGICATSDFSGKPGSFTDGMLKLGAARYFDLLSVHLYDTRPPERSLDTGSDKLLEQWRKTLKDDYGKETAVWHSERSFNCRQIAYSPRKVSVPLEYCDEPQFLVDTFQHKAQYMIRETLLDSIAGHGGRFFWFGMFDYESCFISIRYFAPYGLDHTEFDQSPCPELLAASGLARSLEGMSHPYRQLSWDDAVRACVFTGEKGSVAAIWNWKAGGRIAVDVGKAPCVLRNFFGEPMPLVRNQQGQVVVDLDGSPKYLSLPGQDGEAACRMLQGAKPQ